MGLQHPGIKIKLIMTRRSRIAALISGFHWMVQPSKTDACNTLLEAIAVRCNRMSISSPAIPKRLWLLWTRIIGLKMQSRSLARSEAARCIIVTPFITPGQTGLIAQEEPILSLWDARQNLWIGLGISIGEPPPKTRVRRQSPSAKNPCAFLSASAMGF